MSDLNPQEEANLPNTEAPQDDPQEIAAQELQAAVMRVMEIGDSVTVVNEDGTVRHLSILAPDLVEHEGVDAINKFLDGDGGFRAIVNAEKFGETWIRRSNKEPVKWMPQNRADRLPSEK